MIVEAILTVVLVPLGWAFSALPTIPWPDWFSGAHPCGNLAAETVACLAGDYVGQPLGYFDQWLPATTIVSAASFLAVLGLAAAGFRVVRFVVSLVTGGGGA